MTFHPLLTSGVLAVSVVALAPGANAGVVFLDDFDTYSYQLNWTPPSSVWTVVSGSVDLIGANPSPSIFNFDPGHGGYVDLDGSSGAAGTLETTEWFGPGRYTLSFDLAGNARGDVDKTTTVSLGSWTTAPPLDLASNSAYQLYTFTFTTTTKGHLVFSDNTVGNQNIGNILDNVKLTSIPETSTWAMLALGFAGLGFAAWGRARKTGIDLP
jgi:hypothetical protein